MNRLIRLFNTSIGCKSVMAVTGMLLVLFVIAHLLGNLNVYRGRDAMNSYAYALQGLGALLWLARLILLAIFVIHIVAGLRLHLLNREARPERYAIETLAQRDPVKRARAYAATQMMWSGVLVLMFVIIHLAHFTFGWIMPDAFNRMETLGDGTQRHDVYAMFILGFQNPLMAMIYILLMLVLGAHLFHGMWSMFQSLGFNHSIWDNPLRLTCLAITGLIVLGNCLMPITVLLGYPSLET